MMFTQSCLHERSHPQIEALYSLLSFTRVFPIQRLVFTLFVKHTHTRYCFSFLVTPPLSVCLFFLRQSMVVYKKIQLQGIFFSSVNYLTWKDVKPRIR